MANLMRSGNCIACRCPLADHFDAQNRNIGCAGAKAREIREVDEGRLFKLKVHKNYEARQAALASISDAPRGMVKAKIGGPVRGRIETFPSKRAAETAIHNRFNELLLRFVERKRGGNHA